jgi:hypothetical protein
MINQKEFKSLCQLLVVFLPTKSNRISKQKCSLTETEMNDQKGLWRVIINYWTSMFWNFNQSQTMLSSIDRKFLAPEKIKPGLCRPFKVIDHILIFSRVFRGNQENLFSCSNELQVEFLRDWFYWKKSSYF